MNEFFTKLGNNPTYKRILKNPWTYVGGAVMLSFLQVLNLILLDGGWGVTGPFSYWVAWIAELFGAHPETWQAFASESAQKTLAGGFLNDPASLRNIGLILGAALSALLASQFKIKKIKAKRQVVAAVIGGLLMGYGSKIAGGCTAGALYTGISSLSVSGWVFAVFLFIGAFIGGKLLVKFFM